jgi:hypothetical protein
MMRSRWGAGGVHQKGSGESAEFPTGVKEVLTLLVKSQRSISNAAGVGLTNGMYPISLPFKPCL